MSRTWAALLRISDDAVLFSRRGFRSADARAERHLEGIGRMFLSGYRCALDHDRPELLAEHLNTFDLADRGFAFEGAAMALALLDAIRPWTSPRLARFVSGPARCHRYMIHVGAGWAMARLPIRRRSVLRALDPLLTWLAFDGYGFHEGYFRSKSAVRMAQRSPRMTGYGRNAFDQGVGRSIWFVEGANATSISSTIDGFPEERRPDLWSGVGLACAYAGGCDREGMERLVSLAGDSNRWVGQGAAFAAKARHEAGNPTDHTDLACRTLCGLGADAAAEVTDRALIGLSESEEQEPRYAAWRRRTRELLP